MDSKDFALLVALHENARQSYRQLGQRVSLSAPAIRERLKRLEDRHVLQGYWVYVDPAVFGREDLLVFFDGDYVREDVVKVLSLRDVAFAAWKVDGGIVVQLWPRSRNESMERLTRALRAEPSWKAYTRPSNLPGLSLADWRIVEALLDDAIMPLSTLVEKTGLSPKTVRAHLQSMVRNEVIFLQPLMGSLADAGELVYHVAVIGHVGMPELRGALGDTKLIGGSDDPEMKYLLCRANDLADVTRRTREAEKLPGVETVRVTLNRELMPGNAFVQSLVRERIRDGIESRMNGDSNWALSEQQR